MAIYIDFDDVICQTNVTLRKIVRGRYGRHYEFEDMTQFDLHVSLGLDNVEYPKFMRLFHERHLEEIPEIPDACQTILTWHKAGLSPLVVTGRSPSCHEASLRWLQSHGLGEIPLFHLDKYQRFQGADSDRSIKLDDLRNMKIALAIEDAPPSVSLLQKWNLCPIALFDRPWNRSIPSSTSLRRFRNWRELAETVPAFLAATAATAHSTL